MDQFDQALAPWVVDQARRHGASAVEVMLVSAESITVGVRLGEVEKLKSSRERRLGLRVFVDHASANASTAEFERASLDQFIQNTVTMARLTAPDPFSGLPEPDRQARDLCDLELTDSRGIIAADEALKLARAAEKAALGADPRIRNSEGGDFHSGFYSVLFANSNGFVGEYSASSYNLAVAPIAQSDDGRMQQGYWYSAGRHFHTLDDPESIGKTAAHRALRRLGARKIKTTRAPVVFDPDMAASLLRSVAGAASGPSLYKGASFLLNKLGERIAAPNVTIYDDGTLKGMLGSKPFDGDGLPTSRKALVKEGVLATYLLDTYSARKLKLASTGNAARGVGDAPTVSSTNLYLEPGSSTPEQIIRSVKRGLYVTELIGFGVNAVTGDYSRGAGGLWIEDGELAYPVQEITIAGNLREMFQAVEMIGDDLRWRAAVVAPTIKIAEMTIAGE